ncbi:MAG: hypothetical protein WAN50_01565 [Minisyncoccia bacterium]
MKRNLSCRNGVVAFMGTERSVLISELSQLAEVLAYKEAHPNAPIICIDFWVERELEKKGIKFTSLRDFEPAEETEEEWWVLAQDIAREWYRLPAMRFFEYKGINIGEALEPMLQEYLSRLFYFGRIFLALKKSHPEVRLYIPTPAVEDIPTVGPLAFFERWAVIDAARMTGLQSEAYDTRMLSDRHVFPRTAAKSWTIRLYNLLVGFAPRRPLKIYASEYWSHIAPVIESMNDAELVLMESSQLKNISWRQILKHRIRIQHPADATTGRMKRNAIRLSKEFLEQWGSAKKDVGDYFLSKNAELDWSPVLEACEYLISYSPRIIADIDALRRIMEREKPAVVLQRASIGGHMHHFFLMARISAQLKIPSVELQHAGAVFDPRSVHSRLETSYLAAYGEIEREQYAKNGYVPKRIIPIGSPRIDTYRVRSSQAGHERETVLRSLMLDTERPVVLVAIPYENAGLYYAAFSSYALGKVFQTIQHVRREFPDIQYIFKFRHRNVAECHRMYLAELFPEGGIAIAETDPQPFIQVSDVVLSGNSTILYEAMINHRPLMLYPWKAWDGNLGVYSGVAPFLHSKEELSVVLKKFFSDKSFARDLLEKEQSFIERHAFDGHSSERAAALLRKVSAAGNNAYKPV